MTDPSARDREAAYPPRAYAWTVVGILVLTAILSYTDRQVLSLVVDPIRADLGIDDTSMSLLLGTAFALIYGTAGIPLGMLADRVSRRNLILAGVMIWSLGTLACGLSHSFTQLFAGRIVVGLGEAVLSPAAISLISDYFPPARRGAAVGLFLTGIAIGVGGAIVIGGGVLHLVNDGLLAGTPLAAEAPWRLLLIVIGAPGILWSLAILVIREPVRRSQGEPTKGGAGPVDLAGWLRLAPIFLAVAMASFVDNAVGAWSPTLLIRKFGADPAEIGVQLGLVLMIGFGGGVLGGGILADRFGARGGGPAKVLLCLIAGLLVLPVGYAMTSDRFGLVLLAIPVYFALSGAVTAAGFSAILDFVPNRSRGLAMSVSFFLNVALGAGLGPTAVSVAEEALFDPQTGLASALALTVACGYGLACAALVVQRVLFARARGLNPV